MNDRVKSELDNFMRGVVQRNPGEVEFHQAAREVCESLIPFVLENKKYRDANILERLTELDRTIIYRVSWEDDLGRIQSNRAWRVQFNNVIVLYKGGLRFHPSVNHSVLKFLGFEQSRETRYRGTGRMQLAAWWVGTAYNLVRMAKLPA
jgi:glutamate dehydrogenase (NADP+)